MGIVIAALCCCAAPVRGAPPEVGGCPVFPADNVWNTRVDSLPADSNSALYVTTIGTNAPLHPDFGAGVFPLETGGPMGIPFCIVPGTQPLVGVTFDYDDESDFGPYPIPPDAPVEGGTNATGDRHVLIVDHDHCRLYELYDVYPQSNGTWRAGSGAIFDLSSNALRPETWTSADAAGLPILPGLVRYDEVASGAIQHAIRFTAPETRRAYVWPARHYASYLTEMRYPPMGQRFRLRADHDISSFSPTNQVILRALKQYGMILADNGSSWFISGVPDERWDNGELHDLTRVSGADFEAVDESGLAGDTNSAAVRYPRPRIASIAAAHGSVELQITNLFPGLGCVIGSSLDLLVDSWTNVTAFPCDTAGATWQGILSNAWPCAFYRVAIE